MKAYVCTIGYATYAIPREAVADLLAIAADAIRLEGYGPYREAEESEPFVSMIQLADVEWRDDAAEAQPDASEPKVQPPAPPADEMEF